MPGERLFKRVLLRSNSSSLSFFSPAFSSLGGHAHRCDPPTSPCRHCTTRAGLVSGHTFGGSVGIIFDVPITWLRVKQQYHLFIIFLLIARLWRREAASSFVCCRCCWYSRFTTVITRVRASPVCPHAGNALTTLRSDSLPRVL